jgi:hypothetical protein
MNHCPHCGSLHTRPGAEIRTAGAILGGMAGAAFVVLRIIGRSSPILASALWVGGLIGLAWGGQAGYVLGAKIDQTLPRSRHCCACGKEFDIR